MEDEWRGKGWGEKERLDGTKKWVRGTKLRRMGRLIKKKCKM